MMLCPLTDVDLKLNSFVNVTCSCNIRGEYFKARYFFYHNFEPTYLINGSTNSTGIRSNRMINCLLYIKAAAPNVNFWKMSVRKTIGDLDFSEHLL